MKSELPAKISIAIAKAVHSNPAGKTEISSTFEILANDIADALASIRGFNCQTFLADCDNKLERL